ncbi:MAG: DUF2225 domain-containing protein [Desulfotomaculales bacterium]
MSREIIIRALERISPFAGIDAAVLAQMAEIARVARVPAGAAVFRAGDPADRFFILLAGEVGIYPAGPDDRPAGVVQAGEVFGTVAFFEAIPYPVTAAALKESLLLGIVRSDFERFAAVHPGVVLALNARLRHADACARVPAAQPAGAPLPEELYYTEYTCPCCGEEIRSPAVRSRFIRVVRTDTDFCQHHAGPNPLFYEIVVCPACGYAFNEESYEPLNPQTRKAVRAACAGGQSREGAGPARTLDEAVDLFKLAITCQEARGARPSILGRLYLKLAWLYRFREDAAGEQEALASALRCLTDAFQLEQAGDPKQELHLLYLLGELSRRLGQGDAAVRWFSRVINHPEKRKNPLAVNMAREQWQEIRQQKTRPVS